MQHPPETSWFLSCRSPPRRRVYSNAGGALSSPVPSFTPPLVLQCSCGTYIDPHKLWYCRLFFSFSVPFLNQGSGMIASMTSGTTSIEEFNFTENTSSHQFDSDDDDDGDGDYTGEPLPSQPKQNGIASLHQDDDDRMGEPLPSTFPVRAERRYLPSSRRRRPYGGASSFPARTKRRCLSPSEISQTPL